MHDADQILAACDELARLSETDTGIMRRYLTPVHLDANARVAQWMHEAGMAVHQDAAGNQWGRYEGLEADAPALVIGSHLDTVPDAGRYDGILGVMLAIGVVQRLQRSGRRLPCAIEVVAFGDEEGTRFGSTLLGSRAVAGTWEPEWWALTDPTGICLEQAFEAAGLVPGRIDTARRESSQIVGYLEAHIEQGPVLEDRDLALGVVTAIAGARRARITLTGCAGHAGTTPFDLRRDALCGASEAVLAIEALARASGAVATVGEMNVAPGAVNVIPGDVSFSLDVRAQEDAVRDRTVAAIVESLERICTARELTMHWEDTHSASAVACADWLQDCVSRAVTQVQGDEALHLFSGAGHDAMAMASLTDVGMLFIRCGGGVSHHPDESVRADDVAMALDAFEIAVIRAARQAGLPA
ncbi:allantoate amidohydrolase [Larsenimonas rhizosphaerae]|uniref:allantoate amidohydrolase n=1 Tax=Larsenimonas rhizosphaerae TaxID=2944682 RepID=UPI002033CABA|nr:allantoate amidohydrolase [Larsenimonas rhizosphaerae]MCM2130766.1 allantoate amidohydrolase [Larsenimonas rhizosphaerae]